MSQVYKNNNDVVNSIGGGDVLMDVIKKEGFIGFITKILGKRSPRAEYSYAEAIIMWFVAVCSGAKRFENLYHHKETFKRHPRFNKFISPDTLSYMCKELSVKNIYVEKSVQGKTVKTKRNISHEINNNQNLNRLLIRSALKLGLLKRGFKYILDFDTTTIVTKIRGGRTHFNSEGRRGYSPALAMINNIPVYIENRNGDSNGAFKLTQTIAEAINMLKEYGVNIGTVRVDAAAYSREFVSYCNANKMYFFTRAKNSKVVSLIGNVFNWTINKLRTKEKIMIGETHYDFYGNHTRMVIEQKDKIFRGIVTNRQDITKEEVADIYTKRGDAENLFKYLKGDFGWNLLAMRTIEHNTVYLGLQAFCYLLYTFIVRRFSSVLKSVKRNMRLPTFFNKFMKTPTQWSGEVLVFLDNRQDYYLLSGFT